MLNVVVPAHNAGEYLDGCIHSLLSQTWGDFDLIVLENASTDDTRQRLEAWAARDPRVRVHHQDRLLDHVASANRVVELATAPLVARMDADDLCAPDRLEKQLRALRPDAVLVGTLCETIDPAGRVVRPRDRARLLRPSRMAPFPHGSILFRREAFLAAGGYRAACRYWEDLDLYYRLARLGRLLVVPEALYRYRLHTGSCRLTADSGDYFEAMELMRRCVRQGRRGYDDLLARERPSGEPTLEGLYARLSSAFWIGEDPGLLARVRPSHLRRLDLRSLAILLFAVGATVSPSLLRRAISALIRLRDQRASLPEVVEWRFA